MTGLDFTGRTVLVVGGSSGIGNGIAQGFLNAGAEVHAWGTRPSAADYSTTDGSDLAGLRYQQMNVADTAAIETCDPPFDRLDVLVLSQGIIRYGRREFEMDGFREVLEVNLMSLMACAQRFQPQLKESSGSLIIVSSSAAFHATKGNPAYNAAKTGAVGLTRTLGQAWARDGVRVNGIAPGWVDTKITAVTTKDPDRLESTLARIPVGRLGTAEEMAGVALFLASPLSAYVIGQTILADGGMLL
jgi:3-oxoacyl-[acyl-carrier protein] reductase